jgi:hypothetical protein
MAASNNVNDVSGWLDERLAAASPDLLRAKVERPGGWSELLAEMGECPVVAVLRAVVQRGTVEDLTVHREWAPHVGRFSFSLKVGQGAQLVARAEEVAACGGGEPVRRDRR